ncbi:hypothetical protein PV327_000861 [Microctonus hyperodae]|uniref:Odorant receptor n=1 Tax=Microctonus hyperodae TaxID=165561 RepID=A0AA39G718_MICHY|nr:hypothetical protein PV327_000861 [Microctonus hyperodae]
MDFFDHSYYVTGKNFTRLIGRWPYQDKWERRICSFILILVCVSQYIAQIIGVIRYSDNKEVVLESVTPFMIAIFCSAKYINSIFNLKTMIKLLDCLKEDWDLYTSAEEKRILNEHALIGKFIIYGYVLFVYTTTVVFITEPLMPKWINFILHLNETVPNKFPVPIDWYIIDMEKNFYPLLCYQFICVLAIISISVANDSIFAKLLEDMYVWCFGIVIGINMPLISVTALQLTTQSSTVQQMLKYTMFAGAQMLHLFFDCYLSQQLTDKSTDIQENITLSNWYKMSLNTQKLVILVTLRSQRPCRLTAGKIVFLSMETYASARPSMNFFNHSHYVAGKNFTRAIGQWPYQHRWESRICGFVIVFLVTSQFIAEVIGVIVYIDDKEIVLESVTPFMTAVFCGSKYINAMLNVKTMKKLLNCLEEDSSIYTSKDEIRILNEYAHVGQFLIYGYALSIYVATIVFMTEPLLPKWINFIFHLNETVPNRYPVPIDWYIIDMKKNFYPLFCYESLCYLAMLTITVANDSMFIIFLQHACALFAVVQYQLENLLRRQDWEKELESGKFRKISDVQYNYYMMCIKKHKRAIKFAKLLEDMYIWCFGVVIGINTLLISFTALQLTTQTSTIRQIVKYTIFASAQMMHLFCDCYLSQQLTDKSNDIQKHITLSNWYKMPLHAQKLVIMVMLRSQRPCTLTAGKIVSLSMQTFASIIKTAVSYFTVLVSVQ